jgi:hypothetical protein
MTRRGSLAYYLAAWICGCFFISAAVWLKDLGNKPVQLVTLTGAAGLLFFYFYGLLLGAIASLVGAFLLRRLMALARWEQGWQWALAGAILAPLLIGALGAWWRHATWPAQPGPRWLSLLAYGPSVVLDAGLWLAIPAGAATAFVLYRIHRAFTQQWETPTESK